MRDVQLYTSNLGNRITQCIDQFSSIYMLTSFVMKSGVTVLEQSLREAAERGAEVKICTGDYLYITQPEALERLLHIHEKIEIRLVRSSGTSFHPKAYMFMDEDDGVLFVGSSNMSRSALQNGVEWNLGMKKQVEQETFEDAVKEFMKLHLHESTVSLNEETLKQYKREYDQYHQKHPNLVRTWTKTEEQNLMLPVLEKDVPVEHVSDNVGVYDIKPRFAQIDALRELETALEEGYEKSLVVMATGLGKTYLAAFFGRSFNRILFVAHREEILIQAQRSFQVVHPDKTTGIYNGKVKEREAAVIFASIHTLTQKRHLQQFSHDHFDLIVVDEFHHAAASSYGKVLDYFQPKFLLGITATPYRNDHRDVFSLCDGKVAYQIDFIEAIQHQWLAPFRYYGIYDDTDYENIRRVGLKYDEDELAEAQARPEWYEKALQAWKKHKQTRTLVFCSSVRQAEALHRFFQQYGHRTISLHSQTTSITRNEAIRQLSDGEIEAIFTVDLFNEGVDIPAVDTLLFVRPTESLTVFTQQVGRGLRLHPDKKYCVIIDLIGNYRNADIKMSLFQVPNDVKTGVRNAKQPIAPAGCEIQFELETVNLLQELAKKKMPRREQLLENYYVVKEELGTRPAYVEVYEKGYLDSFEMYRQEFQSYADFLHWAGELGEQEQEALRLYGDWLREIERTGMQKSYKMVVIQAMLERGIEKWFLPITPEEAAPYFHSFYMEKPYRRDKDFSDNTTRAMWEYDERKVSNLIAKMPMTKLSESSKGLISFENRVMKLNFDVAQEQREILWQWTREICEYRLKYYFVWRGSRK